MATAEKRGQWYRIVFRFCGKRYRHRLDTDNASVAASVAGGVNRTLMLLEQRVLQIPKDADVVSFVLSGGQAVKPSEVNEQTKAVVLTLEDLKKKYVDTMSIGAIEMNSLATVTMHLRHISKTLGATFHIQALSLNDVQGHVNRRAKMKGIRGRALSPTTIRKEVATLRAVWNWGVQSSLLTGDFPNKGLKYPKTNEKPPFQTLSQIESQIGRGGLTDAEQQDLWDCLFLQPEELVEFLGFVKDKSSQPFLYPMCCFAAHTGARRSELLRLKISDLDFDAGSAVIQEKKRVHGKRTTRRVPLSRFLVGVLRDWLAVHPGGPSLFCQQSVVEHSKKKRTAATPVTRDEAHDHLKRVFADSKWKIVRGWHLFRHSFCSCCAAKGVDQRMVNAWVGHQTEEMVKRYRHLFPSHEKQAIQQVFG